MALRKLYYRCNSADKDLIGFIVLALVILTCGTVIRKSNAMDITVTHRNLIWSVGTLILFLLTVRRINIHTWLFPAFVGFFLLTAISIFQAINFGEAMYETVRVFVMIVFVFSVAVVIRKYFDATIKTIVLLALILGVYGVCEYARHPGPAWSSHRLGTMGNMNFCSWAHVLLIPFSAYAFRYSRPWKIISVIAILTGLFVIFTLSTRSALLSLFVMFNVAVFSKRKNKQYFFYALTLLPLIMGLTLSNKESPIFNTSSLNQRMDLWRQSLNMAKDNPFGVGAGNWQVGMPVYARNFSDVTKGLGFKSQQFSKAHNDNIELLSEIGIVGLAFYLSIFVLGFYYAIKKKCTLVYPMLAVYVALSFFAFPMQRVFHPLILQIGLACVLSLYLIPNQEAKTRYLTAIPVVIALLFAIFVFAVRQRTEYKMYHVHRAMSVDNWDKVLELTEDISVFATIDYYNTPILSYRGLAHFRKGDYESALNSHLNGFWQNPYHIYPLINIPVCMTNLGRLQEACTWYENILPMFPGYDEIEKRYVDTYMRMKNEQYIIRRR